MKAVVYHRFGAPEVLQVEEVPRPAPKPGQVLVRVVAAALNPKDVLLRKGKLQWLSGKKLPRGVGYDVSGVVEEADPRGGGPAVGTPVFGMINGWFGRTCAEHLAIAVDECATAPASIPLEEAAALPLVGLTALQGLELLKVRPGDQVLVHGASGGVGTAAVQIARLLGARITATCSARNHALVEELGAHRCIDYREEDALAVEDAYDAIFDVFGNRSVPEAQRALKPGGRFCSTVPKGPIIVREALARVGLSRHRLVIVESLRGDLERLARWVEEGGLRPVVDRTLSLEETAEGHRYLETKRARGKVLIRVSEGPEAEFSS